METSITHNFLDKDNFCLVLIPLPPLLLLLRLLPIQCPHHDWPFCELREQCSSGVSLDGS
jgi:hypothetical protein